MIAEIQVVPPPGGTAMNRWANVDVAIDVLTPSDLTYMRELKPDRARR